MPEINRPRAAPTPIFFVKDPLKLKREARPVDEVSPSRAASGTNHGAGKFEFRLGVRRALSCL